MHPIPDMNQNLCKIPLKYRDTISSKALPLSSSDMWIEGAGGGREQGEGESREREGTGGSGREGGSGCLTCDPISSKALPLSSSDMWIEDLSCVFARARSASVMAAYGRENSIGVISIDI